MELETTVAEATLVQQVVLAGVAWSATRDEAPVRADEVRSICNDRFEDVTGRLSPADVSRALSVLAAEGVLEERRPDDRSPAGKGRPNYALEVDPDSVVDALDGEPEVTPLVDLLE